MKRGFLLRAQGKKNNAKAKEKQQPSTSKDGKLGQQEPMMHPSLVGLFEIDPSSGTPFLPPSIEKIDEKDRALPNDYDKDRSRYVWKDTDPDRLDLENTTITTIPWPYDADGRSEWIVNGGRTKAKVIEAPGYPARLPKPRQADMYVVKEMPGMGMGVFATCDIKCGELIFSERPLLVVPRACRLPRDIPAHYTAQQIRLAAMHNQEGILEKAVARMRENDQAAFKALANSHTEDGSGPLHGIVRTNAFDLGIYDGDNEDDHGQRYAGVPAIGSRINHSCQSNVHQSFKLASFSLQFSAFRDIKAGEQLFYSYCKVDQGVAARQAALASYDFVCKCPACVNATPESDKFRSDVKKKIENYNQLYAEKRTKDLSLDAQVLTPLLDLEKAMIEEGMDVQIDFASLLRTIARLSSKLEMLERAREYNTRADSYTAMFEDANE